MILIKKLLKILFEFTEFIIILIYFLKSIYLKFKNV